MAYSKSGWYLHTLMDIFTNVAETGTPTHITLGVAGNTTNQKLSLLSTSTTDYAAPVAVGNASPAWVSTDEITGTGWATGGVLLSTAAAGSDVVETFVSSGGTASAGLMTYGWTNPLSVTGTTLTGIFGFIIYYHLITATVSKPCLLTIFVGTGYNTVAGTFGITPSGSGLSQLTLTG
jgi:hypothetical protein